MLVPVFNIITYVKQLVSKIKNENIHSRYSGFEIAGSSEREGEDAAYDIFATTGLKYMAKRLSARWTNDSLAASYFY